MLSLFQILLLIINLVWWIVIIHIIMSWPDWISPL